jgi:hypothetical protein
MIPFESWINAGDRQNAGNMLVGVNSRGGAVGAWIDYAFSLDHVWKGNNIPNCQLPPMFPPVGKPLDDVMIEVADSILQLENGTIENIVNRVPVEYLPRAAADNIIRNLIARHTNVRTLL